MLVEKWLTEDQLVRYRRWKRKIRATFGNWIETLSLSFSDRSLRRLLEADFSPVFLCGISGSGTTLLSSLLNQNYVNDICLDESARHPSASRLLWTSKAEESKTIDAYIEKLFLPEHNSVIQIRRAVLGLYRRVVKYPRISNIVLDKAPNAHLARIELLKRAFPKSQIVMIYRDPVETIEGLRRKWPIPFGQSSVEALCNFWNLLHKTFLQASRSFQSDVLILSYQELVETPSKCLEAIAELAGLDRRSEPKLLKDRSNKPGKGVRNVVGGKVEIVKPVYKSNFGLQNSKEVQQIRMLTSEVLAELVKSSRLSVSELVT